MLFLHKNDCLRANSIGSAPAKDTVNSKLIIQIQGPNFKISIIQRNNHENSNTLPSSSFFNSSSCCKKNLALFTVKLQQKIYTKTYHIICSLCRSTYLESNIIGLPFYDFFVIYYDFSKVL